MMTSQRMTEIGTQGCCGIIAAILIRRIPGAKPFLRYDGETATHAAVWVPGADRFIHFGEDTGLVEVAPDELLRAVREDFDPSRCGLEFKEITEIINHIIDDMRWW